MKAQLRTTVAAMMFLAPAAATLVALPGTAMAQKAVAPEIHTLSVNADDALRAGSDLQFAVEATPRSRASVVLGKTNIVVSLKETSAGMYRGTYTVRSKDRIDPTAMITARVTRGKLTTNHNFTWPASFQQVAQSAPPAAAPPGIVLAAPRIDQFMVTPAGRIEPGRELRFRLNGLPGAVATFDIPGVVSGVQMREVSPGHYEGRYTVRQRDDLDAFGNAVATLRSGPQVVTARVTRPILRDNEPPQVGNLSPRPGEAVSAAGVTVISGTFDDPGGRGVNPNTVRLTLSGRDVTAATEVTPQRFTYRSDLPPGRYNAELTARDYAGNAVNRSWSFDVGSTRMGAAPSTVIVPSGPLQLLVNTPSNNAQIDANGNLHIAGRTAPFARVNVRVDAVPPVLGNLLGVAQIVATETVQADRDGNFSVNVSPRGSLALPGTRYDISMTATSGTQNADHKIVVFQRQG